MPLPSYQYSGAVYAAPTVGSTTFNLTTAGGSAIGFIDPAHIKVYTSRDNGATLVERFRPAQWEFNGARTQVILAVPTVASESVIVRRITPITGLLTDIPDGINLPAERLRNLQLVNLYIIQEAVEANTAAALLAADTAAQSSLILATVASQLPYTLYAARANVPANPGSAISGEVLDSTNMQTFTPLTGVPAGFIGSNSLIVRIRYNVGLVTWQWVDYRPVNADLRYLLKTQIVNSVASSSVVDPASANAAKTAYDAAIVAQGSVASLTTTVTGIQATIGTQYTAVANVAGIPGSPANGTRIEIANSTGIESFSPLSGRPSGFVGSSLLSVRLIYSTVGLTWTWFDYSPIDPDARFLGPIFLQTGAGSVGRTVASKLQEEVSVADKGAIGDGAFNNSAAFTAALAVSQNVKVPKGTAGGNYYLLTNVTVPLNYSITLEYGVVLSGPGTLSGPGIIVDESAGGLGPQRWINKELLALEDLDNDAIAEFTPAVIFAQNNAAKGNGIVGSVVQVGPGASFPTGVTGYCKMNHAGNTGFGLFGKVDLFTAGVATNELNTFNYRGAPPAAVFPPNRSFGTPDPVCVTLTIAAGGTFQSMIGIQIDREGSEPNSFQCGYYSSPLACTEFGVFVDATTTAGAKTAVAGNIRGTVADSTGFFSQIKNASPAATTRFIKCVESTGGERFAVLPDGRLNFQSVITQTTNGGAGGASALPATPLGYIRMLVGATSIVVPFYTA